MSLHNIRTQTAKQIRKARKCQVCKNTYLTTEAAQMCCMYDMRRDQIRKGKVSQHVVI